jgi:four helix bundle protein
MRDYRRLVVRSRAHALALTVYRETAGFPHEERFGLVSQMRRAAVSVPSNIAEGCGRGSDSDFARFLRIAWGSVNEIEYQATLARDLGYLSENSATLIDKQCSEVRRMLTGLLNKLAAGSWQLEAKK